MTHLTSLLFSVLYYMYDVDVSDVISWIVEPRGWMCHRDSVLQPVITSQHILSVKDTPLDVTPVLQIAICNTAAETLRAVYYITTNPTI